MRILRLIAITTCLLAFLAATVTFAIGEWLASGAFVAGAILIGAAWESTDLAS